MVAEVAVLGAGGGTGQKCVEKLLSQNKTVKAIVRDPSKYGQLWQSDDNLSIAQGDVTNLQSIEAALEGVKSIIFAVSASSYLGANSVDRDVSLSKLTTCNPFENLNLQCCNAREISRR